MMYCSMGDDFWATNNTNGARACDASQVIALDIDDHRQLRVFFWILVEFANQIPILFRAFSARSGSFDWARVKPCESIGICWAICVTAFHRCRRFRFGAKEQLR